MNKILNNVYLEEQIAEITWKMSEFTDIHVNDWSIFYSTWPSKWNAGPSLM